MANGIRDLPDEEPPPKVHKDSSKLCIPCSRDLRSIIFGCPPLQAGNNSFRSLVMLGSLRRNRLLAFNQDNK